LEGLTLALWLSSSRWQVAKDITKIADKDNAVPGRVAAVPLDLANGHYKTFSVFDVTTAERFVVAFVRMMATY
jgi:hypothetical protein